MHLRVSTACFLVLSAAQLITAADSPFIGKWKLNMDKSDFTAETVKFESAGSGKYEIFSGGQSYMFTTDGKEHPGMFGRIVSYKEVDANNWQETVKFKGKVLSNVTWTLSSDGKTLTETAKGTRPDGSSFENTTVYDRSGEGSGFAGTWKSKEDKQASPSYIEFADNGPDGIEMNLSQIKAKCRLKFDGKDYPASGPTVPAGLTLAMTKTDDRTLEMTEKIKGKPVFKTTYTVSDDGKTITENGGSVGVNEPVKAVWDKE